MNKPGKTAINNLKRLASFWSPIYILIAVTLLSVTACDSTYQYKELRIVSVDKLGTMDENKEVPEEAMDKLQFFLYHEGEEISFYPKEIILERLDNSYDFSEKFESEKSSKGRFSKSRPEKISDSRKDDLLTFLKDNDDVFKKSVMLYAEQLRRLDDYIDNNTEDISMEQIIIYNEDFWGEDTTLNHFEFENLHFKPESVFNHIESILLDTDKEQEKLDELSIVIILIPTGKLTPDTVIITNPTSVSGAQRIAQYLPEDGSYESKFGPFVANIADPDSITWEISAISGYKIEPQKGISDTKIKLTIEDISGNGVVRIVVTPYKAGMYSQQEEIDVTFSKVMGEMTKIETDKKAKSDKEKQEAIEREKQAKVEKERLAKIEREKQANTERERLAQIEREKQANAERERLARIEREKQANAERERLAQIEREKQANAERERQELIEKDPCPPVSEIITINDQRQKIIEEFKTEVYHIWGGEELPDPANIPLYKEEAKKSIAMIPGCKIECTPLGNNLDRFLNELATKNYNIKPEIQSRLDDCGVIDGIVIKIN